jgi:hypothetical protein
MWRNIFSPGSFVMQLQATSGIGGGCRCAPAKRLSIGRSLRRPQRVSLHQVARLHRAMRQHGQVAGI